MYQAFPGADYYGVSVALGLAPLRRSRSMVTGNVTTRLRAAVRHLIGLIDPVTDRNAFPIGVINEVQSVGGFTHLSTRGDLLKLVTSVQAV